MTNEAIMEINIIVPAVMALLLLGAMHGVMIKWHGAHGPYTPLKDAEEERMRQVHIVRWRKLWHKLALGIRIFIWLIVWLIGRDWQPTLLVVLLTAIEYNISINLINDLKWYYVGTTAQTDILIRKLFPRIKW